ncbi:capsid cement protein [Acinetobacter sp. c3-l95]|uniref:capsid cement protein n=1 Tax=Acinetobacter sp. c3-l95 TaxID=3342804 RepID=UPI0035BB8ED9
MNHSNPSTQAVSLLNLSVTVQQDTPKGTWVSAKGELITANQAPIGVTQNDAKKGTMVAVTAVGTASMNLAGIASGAVKQGQLIILDGTIQVSNPSGYAMNARVIGVVLYDAHQSGHAEVLIC